MKILFTNTGPWGTGSATVVDGVMQELHRLGHEARVIFPDSGFASPDYARYYRHPEKFHILKFPAAPGGEYLYTFPLIITDPHPRNYHHAWTFKNLSERQLRAYMDYFGAAADRIINEFQPDIIECQHIWIMDYVLEQKGYSYISVAHHSDQMGFRYDTRMRAYAARAAEKAAHIFAISESVREEVLSLYPVTEEKVSVCANGYDQRVFRPRRVQRRKLLAAHHLEDYEDMPIITFAGKISKTKGADYLLRANQIIQKQKDTLILIFGAGELEDVVDPELREEFDLKNVVVMGHQPQDVLSRFHNIARLSVLPSRSEGFGIAALEAMGCGLPVVASDTGGLHDFIVGSLVPCGDSRAIADRVLALLALPESAYRELCEEALARARRYSWTEIVRKRMSVYERVSGEAIPPVRSGPEGAREPERAAARGSSES